MSYSIRDIAFKYDSCGKTSTGLTGVVQCMCELSNFIEDYRICKHHVSCILLGKSLADKFAVWQVARSKDMSIDREKCLRSIFGLANSAIMGNGYGLIINLGGLYAQIALEMIAEGQEPPSFMILNNHYQKQVNGGQTCIFLDLNPKGYSSTVGMGWLVAWEGLHGRRYI